MQPILFWSMIFCHIIDDFVLQPICLSKLKQKEFWEKNAPDEMYKYDYKVALYIHAISWSISIMIPLAVFTLLKGCNLDTFNRFLFVAMFANPVIHTVVDDLKANKHLINLEIDQIIHFGQIVLTYVSYVYLFNDYM